MGELVGADLTPPTPTCRVIAPRPRPRSWSQWSDVDHGCAAGDRVVVGEHAEGDVAGIRAADVVVSGGFGYLLKDRVLRVGDFLDSLDRVAAGGSGLDPEIVRTLLAPIRLDDPVSDLTAREREVLGLVAEDRTNASIAATLVIAEGTVETHMHSIFQKLRIPTTETATAASWPSSPTCAAARNSTGP